METQPLKTQTPGCLKTQNQKSQTPEFLKNSKPRKDHVHVGT